MWCSLKVLRRLLFLTLLEFFSIVSVQSQTVDSHYFPTNNDIFYSLALHSDGRVLVGYAGGYVQKAVQLYADGTLDPSLQMPDGLQWEILAMAVQEDGKILVGGDGGPLVRINPNGSVDPTFDSSSAGLGPVLSLVLQPDGKILVTDNGSSPFLKRLNADGTLDSSFTAPAGATGGIALQPDGKIFVGGSITSNGQTLYVVRRLDTNGTVDTSFNSTLNGAVFAILPRTNGQILIGGEFSTVNGQAHTNIARLNSDGSVDSTFNVQTDVKTPNDSTSKVECMVPQANGKVIFSGQFITVNGQPRHRLARVNSDGSLDSGFNVDANGEVSGILILPDGNFFIGGFFNLIGATSIQGVARFINNEGGSSQLSVSNSTIQWVRSGSVCDVRRTMFAYSTNGSTWVDLGPGIRTQTGWQYSGGVWPSGASIRARGATVSGYMNGSSSYCESIIGPPAISLQPIGVTNAAGSTTALTVSAGGDGPLSFTWLKNGVPLVDDARTAGSTTRTLTLSPIYKADTGSYSVVVSNSLGTATSVSAAVGVIDPYIYSSSTSQQVNAGTNVVFSVIAGGTPPLFYQWRKDGADVAGATSSSLSLSNVLSSDSGTYTVVVSNSIGSLTSSPASLMVNYVILDGWYPYLTGAGGLSGGAGPVAFQRDDKTVIGGHGSTYYYWGTETKVYALRFNVDGSIDNSFNPAPNSTVGYSYGNTINYVGIDDNDRVLVAGQFVTIGGQSRNGIARLNSVGSADAFDIGTNTVSAPLGLQPDGKLLAIENGTVVRLNADATQDITFAATTLTGGGVRCIALQRDGSIIIGGDFTAVNGVPRSKLARLDATGNLDPSFNISFDNSVYCAVVQPDGRILVGGQFSTVGSQSHQCIARLNADGTSDAAFAPYANGVVNAICLQSDGAILVGGGFTTLNAVSNAYLGRLNSNGTIDPTFNIAIDPAVNGVAVDRLGNIVVTGTFAHIGGVYRWFGGRLKQFLPPTESLSVAASTATWLRGGPGPEFWRVHFSYSADGLNWSDLGEAQPISGGWQLSGISQQTGVIRARGYIANGNQSSWYVEQQFLFGPAKVLMSDGQFGFRTNHFGFTIVGTNSEQVIIDASQNLTDWTPVATNVVSSNSVYFGDSTTPTMPMRFYRLRSQ